MDKKIFKTGKEKTMRGNRYVIIAALTAVLISILAMGSLAYLKADTLDVTNIFAVAPKVMLKPGEQFRSIVWRQGEETTDTPDSGGTTGTTETTGGKNPSQLGYGNAGITITKIVFGNTGMTIPAVNGATPAEPMLVKDHSEFDAKVVNVENESDYAEYQKFPGECKVYWIVNGKDYYASGVSENENNASSDTGETMPTTYTAYILADAVSSRNPIYANPDSSYMFGKVEKKGSTDTPIDTPIKRMIAVSSSVSQRLRSIDWGGCFDTSYATTMEGMFNGCMALGVSIPDGESAPFDVSCFNTKDVTNMSHMFEGCISLFALDVSSFDTAKVTDMSYMFANCTAYPAMKGGSFNTSAVTTMQGMFAMGELEKLEELVNMKRSRSRVQVSTSAPVLDVSSFDTSNVTDMAYMFMGREMENLELSSFNTVNVTTMQGMFQNCEALTYLDVSNFDTSNVTDMSYMFAFCSAYPIMDDSFNTAKVKNMGHMFEVTEFVNMPRSIPALDVSRFDTSNVTDMSYMFAGRQMADLDVSRFNTANVETMEAMFRFCDKLEQLDVSSFVTAKLTNTKQMFYDCINLERIFVSDMERGNWTGKSVTNSTDMFYQCNSLVATGEMGATTNYEAEVINIERARVPELGNSETRENPEIKGYFTLPGTLEKVTLLPGTAFNANINNIIEKAKTKSSSAVLKSITFGNKRAFVTNTSVAAAIRDQGAGVRVSVESGGTCDGYYVVNGNDIDIYLLTEVAVPIYANADCYNMFNGLATLQTVAGAELLDTFDVTTMKRMFGSCTSLTALDVSKWNTSNVTDMNSTFSFCSSLQALDVSNWNTSKVADMGSTFNECSSLQTLNVSNWSTSIVTNMGSMFNNCSSLQTLNVSNWNTSNVTNMYGMFNRCMALTTLGENNVRNWDTSNVSGTGMMFMFSKCESLQALDVSNWNTSKVTSMECVFQDCKNLTTLGEGNVRDWNTSNVTNMTQMFLECESLQALDVSNWNTSNVIDMGQVFQDCKNLTTLGENNVRDWDTSNVISMDAMFSGCTGLTALDVSNWNTSNVTNMSAMFSGCTGLTTLDVSSWTTTKVTNMAELFKNCSNLKTIYVAGVEEGNWAKTAEETAKETGSGVKSGFMFSGCTSLVGTGVNGKTTKYTSGSIVPKNVKSARVPVPDGHATYEEAEGYFTYVVPKVVLQSGTLFNSAIKGLAGDNLENINKIVFDNTKKTPEAVVEDGNGKDVSAAGDGSCMAYKVAESDGTTVYVTWTTDAEVYANQNSSGMFKDCASTTEIDVSQLHTSDVTDMNYMFNGCSGLTALDVSNFDTSKVTNMAYMFYGCKALTTLGEKNVSNFDTSKVTTMRFMFYNCRELETLDVSNFDTSSVNTMRGMFYYCKKLTKLDVSNFNTSKVTDTAQMFNGCSGLTTLDVSNFDTSKVRDMSFMFANCSGLTGLNVDNFVTSSVTNMTSMFQGCSGLATLNVNNFNTSKVANMSLMFYTCTGLQSLDLSTFDMSEVTATYSMFYGCENLIELKLSTCSVTSKLQHPYTMFYMCKGLTTLDVSSLNIKLVTDMSQMFSDCSSLEKIYVDEANGNWFEDGVNVTNSYAMFSNCPKLTGGNGTTTKESNVGDIKYARIDTEGAPGYFTAKGAGKMLKKLTVSGNDITDADVSGNDIDPDDVSGNDAKESEDASADGDDTGEDVPVKEIPDADVPLAGPGLEKEEAEQDVNAEASSSENGGDAEQITDTAKGDAPAAQMRDVSGNDGE